MRLSINSLQNIGPNWLPKCITYGVVSDSMTDPLKTIEPFTRLLPSNITNLLLSGLNFILNSTPN